MGTTPESAYAVQALLAFPFLIMGLSHIFQPKMWIDFFAYLHGLGTTGVVLRIFCLELIPAMVIIAFHSVWTGPEIILSIYGVLLSTKITLGLLVPSLGLKSLAMADQHGRKPLQIAGVLLVLLSIICFVAIMP